MFETSWGWAGITASEYGICRVVLPCKTSSQARDESVAGIPATEARYPFQAVIIKLKDFFDGKAVAFFDEPLDFSGYSEFASRVWLLTRQVTYGTTSTYGGIAALLGKPGASRAVGNALNKNPVPVIVPCHRIIRQDGSTGGFYGGTGLKTRLLQLENQCRPG